MSDIETAVLREFTTTLHYRDGTQDRFANTDKMLREIVRLRHAERALAQLVTALVDMNAGIGTGHANLVTADNVVDPAQYVDEALEVITELRRSPRA